MAEVASAFVSLMPSAKGFGRSSESQIGPQMNGVAKRTGSRFGKVFAYSSMSPLKAIGAAAVGLFAVQKVKDFFQGAIGEARESQKVSAITAQVIKSTGGAANISANQVGKLAGSISNLTGIDDEAIQSGANLLLTFKNIRNEAGRGNDIFNQTTSIMTDMATAMGKEPKAAAIQLGKALNDPIKGISALSRVGVTFSDGQKKVIESLVASGDVVGAQKIILRELKSEFGGTAAAAATAGEKFRTAFANFQEAVGTALLPTLDRGLTLGTKFIGFLMDEFPPAFAAAKAAIAPLTDVLSDLITNHLEAFQTALAALGGAGVASLIALIGGGLVGVLGVLVSALASPVVLIGALAGAAIYAYTRFASFRQVVGQVVAWLKSDFIPGFLAVVAGVRAFVAQVWPIITEFAAGIVAQIQPLLPRIAAVFQQIWSTIKDAFTLIAAVVKGAVAIISWEWEHFGTFILDFIGRTFGNIVTVVSGVLNILQGVIRLVLSLIKGDWSGAWDALKQIVRGVWQIISGIVKQAIAQIQLVLNVAWAVIKAGAAKAWDGIKSAISSAINAAKGVVTAQVNAIKAAMSGIADLIGKVRGWFAEIVDAIRNKLENAVKLVSEFPGKAARALGDLGNTLYSYGRNLIQGFINGIKDKAGEIVGAVTGPISSAIKGVGSLLEIGSPSRLFHQIGQWTMEGFANGIKTAGPKVLKEMDAALTKTLDKVTAFRDGIASRLDSVKSAFSSLKDSIASTFAGDLFSGANLGEFFTNAIAANGRLRQLVSAFKTLRGWGLPAGFLSGLFQSGNSDLILALASGPQSQAQMAADLIGSTQSLSQQLGGQVARNQYGVQIDRLEKRLDRIDENTRYLRHLAKDLGHELNDAGARAGRRR